MGSGAVLSFSEAAAARRYLMRLPADMSCSSASKMSAKGLALAALHCTQSMQGDRQQQTACMRSQGWLLAWLILLQLSACLAQSSAARKSGAGTTPAPPTQHYMACNYSGEAAISSAAKSFTQHRLSTWCRGLPAMQPTGDKQSAGSRCLQARHLQARAARLAHCSTRCSSAPSLSCHSIQAQAELRSALGGDQPAG